MKEIECYVMDTLREFDKKVDRFIEKKKFKKLPDQIEGLEESLIKGEFPGDLVSRKENPVPHEVYKLRLPNPDTKVGKSNGYRVYYIVVTEQRIVVFLTIYYKKEDDSDDCIYYSIDENRNYICER